MFVFASFVHFLVFFLFLHSNFCLFSNANNKRQERKLIFIVDAQFGHSAAGIGTLISECVDTKVNVCWEQEIAQNEIHSLIINRRMYEWMKRNCVKRSRIFVTNTYYNLNNIDFCVRIRKIVLVNSLKTFGFK